MRFVVRSETIVTAATEADARRLVSENVLRSAITGVELAPYAHASRVPSQWAEALAATRFAEVGTVGQEPTIGTVTFGDVGGTWLTDVRVMLLAPADWEPPAGMKSRHYPNWMRAKSELRPLTAKQPVLHCGEQLPKMMLNTHTIVDRALFSLIELLFPTACLVVPTNELEPIEARLDGVDGPMVAALMPIRYEPTEIVLDGEAA